MKKILLLSVLFTLALSQQIFACECASNPPFLAIEKSENVKTIVLVKILRYLTYLQNPHGEKYITSMEVEIQEIYRGEEKRKKITIWGSDGAMCREYLSQFEIGKQYIFAPFQFTDFSDSQTGRLGEKKNDYDISNCGEYWLSVENGIATGNIAEGVKSMSLKDLKLFIQEPFAIKTKSQELSSQSILPICFRWQSQFFIRL